jgi:putative transposase
VKNKRRALGLTRRRSLPVTQRDACLLPRIQQLNAEPPCWGHRRIWASLRFVEQMPVTRKRSLRLMREPHLLVQPTLRLKAKRTPTGSKPRPTVPHEWWGLEMTKVMVTGFGWISMVVVLDGYTKKIVGFYAGVPCTAQPWLAALSMAVNQQFPEGGRGQGLSLMSDNGCQPTSLAFMKACRTLEIPQAFTSDNNPKGNADTERVIRTLKEECLWLQEWTCPCALVSAVAAWIDAYNEHYLHSTLGYKPPRQFEREYYASHSPPCVAA